MSYAFRSIIIIWLSCLIATEQWVHNCMLQETPGRLKMQDQENTGPNNVRSIVQEFITAFQGHFCILSTTLMTPN